MAMEWTDGDRVEEALDPTNEDRTVAQLHALSERATATGVRRGVEAERAELARDAAWIGSVLVHTRSKRVRNAAALAILDLRLPDGAQRLASLLAEPSIAPAAGTLLYAIDKLGAVLPLQAFLTVMRHGSAEAVNEVLGLMEEGRIIVSDPEELRRARDLLASLSGKDDSERAEAARAGLALLSDRTGAGYKSEPT